MKSALYYQQYWKKEQGRGQRSGNYYPELEKGYQQQHYLIDLGCDKTCRYESSCSEDSCEDLSYLSEPSFQRCCPPLHATCTNTDTEPEPCECKDPLEKCKPLKPPSRPCYPKRHCKPKHTSKCSKSNDTSWSSYVKK